MSDKSEEETGHRLINIGTKIAPDGRHTLVRMLTAHRDTGEARDPFKFFTDYEGLSLLIKSLQQAAQVSVNNLVNSGASEKLTKELREIQVEHYQSSATVVSSDKAAVSLQIQTVEGTLSNFSIDPDSAKKLAESLIDAVKKMQVVLESAKKLRKEESKEKKGGKSGKA